MKERLASLIAMKFYRKEMMQDMADKKAAIQEN
jgi:hypothetical protein